MLLDMQAEANDAWMTPFKGAGFLPRELPAARARGAISLRDETWASAQRLLMIDFHLASLASELQAPSQSSFALPLAARSMCNRRVRYFTEKGSLCPRWSEAFPRSLIQFLHFVPEHYIGCLEAHLDEGHPCKGRTPSSCHASFIAAV